MHDLIVVGGLGAHTNVLSPGVPAPTGTALINAAVRYHWPRRAVEVRDVH